MSFEASIARLEEIVAELEGDELALDHALQLFERGIEQLRAAAVELERAEAHVKQLVEQADGTFETTDLRA